MKETAELIEHLNSLFTNLQGNPTHIYNEGWMLRLVLNWFSAPSRRDIAPPLSMRSDAKWYSEAKLSSQFLHPPLAEGYTTSDAVYGDIAIGNKGKSDVTLINPWRQFVVVEAKMNSLYDTDVTNAKGYNQSARTVACMSKVIELSMPKNYATEGERPTNMSKLLRSGICNSRPPELTIEDYIRDKEIAFYTLLPRKQIADEPTFKEFTAKEHINKTVEERIALYKKEEGYKQHYEIHQEWKKEVFVPLLEKIEIKLISWEDVIRFICRYDPRCGEPLDHFYYNCLRYNNLQKI
jgi:hypothetical protein